MSVFPASVRPKEGTSVEMAVPSPIPQEKPNSRKPAPSRVSQRGRESAPQRLLAGSPQLRSGRRAGCAWEVAAVGGGRWAVGKRVRRLTLGPGPPGGLTCAGLGVERTSRPGREPGWPVGGQLVTKEGAEFLLWEREGQGERGSQDLA